MTHRMAFPLLALLAATGCSGRDATSPMSPVNATALSPSTAAANRASNGERQDDDRKASPREGALHAVKDCSAYTGQAGSSCILTSSNLKQIPAGSRVVYEKALGATSLDTDIILYPPGNGNNAAFGHVVLDLVTRTGVATLSGGTGKFRGFRARVDISYLEGRTWAWDGRYSFTDLNDDD